MLTTPDDNVAREKERHSRVVFLDAALVGLEEAAGDGRGPAVSHHHLDHGEERRREVKEELGAALAEERCSEDGIDGRDDEEDAEGVDHGDETPADGLHYAIELLEVREEAGDAHDANEADHLDGPGAAAHSENVHQHGGDGYTHNGRVEPVIALAVERAQAMVRVRCRSAPWFVVELSASAGVRQAIASHGTAFTSS